MAAAVDLHDLDRRRSSPPAAAGIRCHPAEIRSHGAARQGAGRHDARRVVAADDGLQRQRHRALGAAGGARLARSAAVAQRSARADREPYARGPPRLSRHGARARGLDRGDFLELAPGRHRDVDAASRPGPKPPRAPRSQESRCNDRRQSGNSSAHGLHRAACALSVAGARRDRHAQSSGTQKSADVRKLRRARQYLSRCRPRQKRQGDRRHRRRRQFLFRRRRVRDHQAAHRDGYEPAFSISRA